MRALRTQGSLEIEAERRDAHGISISASSSRTREVLPAPRIKTPASTPTTSNSPAPSPHLLRSSSSSNSDPTTKKSVSSHITSSSTTAPRKLSSQPTSTTAPQPHNNRKKPGAAASSSSSNRLSALTLLQSLRKSITRSKKKRFTDIPEAAPVIAWKSVNFCLCGQTSRGHDLLNRFLRQVEVAMEACDQQQRNSSTSASTSRLASRLSSSSTLSSLWRGTSGRLSMSSRGRGGGGGGRTNKRTLPSKLFIPLSANAVYQRSASLLARCSLVTEVGGGASAGKGRETYQSVMVPETVLSPSDAETAETVASSTEMNHELDALVFSASKQTNNNRTSGGGVVLVSCTPHVCKSWKDDADPYAAVSLFLAVRGADLTNFVLWSRTVLLRAAASSVFVLMDPEREAECRKIFPEGANFVILGQPEDKNSQLVVYDTLQAALLAVLREERGGPSSPKAGAGSTGGTSSGKNKNKEVKEVAGAGRGPAMCGCCF